MFLFSEKS